jgi:hypothetical protein
MWKVKATVIPVITGSTGTIPRSFRQYLSNILGNQVTAKCIHIGQCTHTLESTNMKVQNIFNM